MKLNGSLRISLIIFSVIIITAASYLIINELTVPHYENNEIILLSTINKASLDYTVFLKPNSLYEGRILEKGKAIITEYVDHIMVSCNYHYTGSQKSDITGSYEVVGIMETFTGDAENKITIWEKKYVLSPKSEFEQTGNEEFKIKKDIDIKLSDYNEFAGLISAESKINARTQLSIFMNVNLKAVTDNGAIEESLTPNLVIPLMNNYFIIEGKLTEEKPSEIKKTVRQVVPFDYNKVYVLIAADVLLVLFIAFILIFTRKKEIDPHEKLLMQILRKHGDRMVALKDKISDAYEYQYEVKSIDDLVRISDEIDKPIVYQFYEDINYIDKFFVINEKELYFYNTVSKNTDYSETVQNMLESLAADNQGIDGFGQ